MKIYQIYETSGMFEDKYTEIVGTFLNCDTAEKEMQKLIKKDAKFRRESPTYDERYYYIKSETVVDG